MSSVFQWIVGALTSLDKRLKALLNLIFSRASFVLTIFTTIITLVVNGVYHLIEEAFGDAFEWVSDALELPEMLNPTGVAAYICREWLALDVAFDVVILFAGVWVLAKSFRLVMIPIKAVLDIV